MTQRMKKGRSMKMARINARPEAQSPYQTPERREICCPDRERASCQLVPPSQTCVRRRTTETERQCAPWYCLPFLCMGLRSLRLIANDHIRAADNNE